MRDIAVPGLPATRGPVRLRTLTTLRWLAVGGQTAAIMTVHFAFDFPSPLGLCLGVIAASAWLNVFTMLRFSPQRVLSDREAAAYIAFDIVQLCALLYLTGGLQNPFAVLILAPVTIAASVLPLRLTIAIGALAVFGISVLGVVNLPLPWRAGEALALPRVYLVGVWTALAFSVCFFAAYARRISDEAAEMKTALTATQMVLAREERLSALGALAAAAAHELGTPLATIQVTASEMADELKGRGALEEDARLLVAQSRRCREIPTGRARRRSFSR
jgi:two-component system sensor histidine kinase RegB